MANLEPLKNLNTLLEQVLNLAEKDPSLGKMLELAGQMAKNWRPAAPRERTSTPTTPVETEEEQPSTGGAEMVNSLDKLQALNSTVRSLGNMLEMVNQLAKQVSKFGPMLTVMMKGLSTTIPARKSHHSEKFQSIGYGDLDNTTIMSTLIAVLIPVLLIKFAKKSA